MTADEPELVGDEDTPTGRLTKAIQEFISETSDRDTPVLLDTAIVVWEQMRYNDEGRLMRSVKYSCPTPGGGMASYVGLVSMAGDMLASDLMDDEDDEP